MKHYLLTLYNKNFNDWSNVKSVPSGCSKEMANNMKIKYPNKLFTPEICRGKF
jgi:hypothetical protein